jgi:hypothetical protein
VLHHRVLCFDALTAMSWNTITPPQDTGPCPKQGSMTAKPPLSSSFGSRHGYSTPRFQPHPTRWSGVSCCGVEVLELRGGGATRPPHGALARFPRSRPRGALVGRRRARRAVTAALVAPPRARRAVTAALVAPPHGSSWSENGAAGDRFLTHLAGQKKTQQPPLCHRADGA